jgi:hypothetical protein
VKKVWQGELRVEALDNDKETEGFYTSLGPGETESMIIQHLKRMDIFYQTLVF